MNNWIVWLAPTILAVLGILAVGWKLLRAAFRVDAALPTLLGIADEFRTDDGGSLKDHIDAIRAEQAKVATALVVASTTLASERSERNLIASNLALATSTLQEQDHKRDVSDAAMRKHIDDDAEAFKNIEDILNDPERIKRLFASPAEE